MRSMMMNPLKRRIAEFAAALMLCAGLCGCQSSTTTPTSVGTEKGSNVTEAVAKLDSMFVAIRDGMANDDHESVHDALHDVFGPIKTLTTLESDSNLNIGTREDIQDAAEEMASLYGKLDEAAHHGEEMDYDEVADQLAAAMDKIKSLVK